MRVLKSLTIRQKLTSIAMLSSITALVSASIAFLVYDLHSFRQSLARRILTDAQIVGFNSVSPLLFNDAETATTTLGGLRADPAIVAAIIRRENGGQAFATYLRDGASAARPSFPPHSATGPVFISDHLLVSEPIRFEGKPIGTLLIQADLGEIYARQRSYAGIVLAVLAGSFLLALTISRLIEKTISRPIVRLADTARAVSSEKDYSVRAQGEGHDEIGLLVGTFNEMLNQIQDRDAALQRARDDLERQVDERTRDLQMEVAERRLLAEQLREKNQELEQQSLKVQEATRLKSEFLANMSHELRTPLNAIVGFAELMHDGRVGPVSGPHKECLADILTSSRHLLQLINDVLDLSKVEAGKMEFRPEVFQLPKIVGEVRDILRTISATKRIVVTTEFEPGLEEIFADAGKLKQVLYNYLSNALKFTPDGGRVTIRTRTEGRDLFRIEVQDSGIGIRPEDLSRLFIEFQQLDAGTAKTHQGTGLGLALTKRIVEAQGGHVGVSSTPGESSLFYAVLPRVATGASAALLVPAPRAGAATGPTMLVIEDDATERAWLVATITAGGYTVDAAASGKEALELCRSRKYDGITLDLFLPDSTGWDILREIRRSGPNLETPVIVVTVVAEKRLGAGFAIHDYLVKPVREDQLLWSLRRTGATPADIGMILVVDDDPQARRLVDTTLTGAGYRVVTVSSAEQGLRAVSNAPWAAVILDLLMPGMDGFDFLDRFQSSPQGRATPVIVWTAKDLTSDDYRRLAASAHGVVLKRQGGAGLLVEELRLHIAPSPSEPSPEPESSSSERDRGQ